jgi:hypothetical protein
LFTPVPEAYISVSNTVLVKGEEEGKTEREKKFIKGMHEDTMNI